MDKTGKAFNMQYSNDDLKYAIENNSCSIVPVWILAEKPGNNDEDRWFWLVQTDSGKYALLSGWCDYTGWGCQSGMGEEGPFDTVNQALNTAPEREKSYGYLIRKCLEDQLNGAIPFGMVDEIKHKAATPPKANSAE